MKLFTFRVGELSFKGEAFTLGQVYASDTFEQRMYKTKVDNLYDFNFRFCQLILDDLRAILSTHNTEETQVYFP